MSQVRSAAVLPLAVVPASASLVTASANERAISDLQTESVSLTGAALVRLHIADVPEPGAETEAESAIAETRRTRPFTGLLRPVIASLRGLDKVRALSDTITNPLFCCW